jgi:hypothetical protein
MLAPRTKIFKYSVPEVVFINKFAELRSVETGDGVESALTGSNIQFLSWYSVMNSQS